MSLCKLSKRGKERKKKERDFGTIFLKIFELLLFFV